MNAVYKALTKMKKKKQVMLHVRKERVTDLLDIPATHISANVQMASRVAAMPADRMRRP